MYFYFHITCYKHYNNVKVKTQHLQLVNDFAYQPWYMYDYFKKYWSRRLTNNNGDGWQEIVKGICDVGLLWW